MRLSLSGSSATEYLVGSEIQKRHISSTEYYMNEWLTIQEAQKFILDWVIG